MLTKENINLFDKWQKIRNTVEQVQKENVWLVGEFFYLIL